MITVKVDTSGLAKMATLIGGMQKQIAFATAVALTETAKKVKDEMPSIMERQLERPTPFTKSGLFVKAARKTNLEAVVGIKDIQAKYLQLNIEGGTRRPGKQGLKLPSAINLNEFGNIPRGVIRQLMSVAKKESGLSKRTSRRIKISNKIELFYGDPRDVGAKDYPPGIYKRVDQGNGRNQLIPLVVFPVVNARYKPRFRFYDEANKIIRKTFDYQFAMAYKRAMDTAR
jgi:hypothetical protein